MHIFFIIMNEYISTTMVIASELLPQTADDILEIKMSENMDREVKLTIKQKKLEDDYKKWLNSEETQQWKQNQLRSIRKQITDAIENRPYCKFWPRLTPAPNIRIQYRPLEQWSTFTGTKNMLIKNAESDMLMEEINKNPGYYASSPNYNSYPLHTFRVKISADLWKTLKKSCNSTKTNCTNN